ncbi:hypothetical protein D9M68_689360 [compost metagenome]
MLDLHHAALPGAGTVAAVVHVMRHAHVHHAQQLHAVEGGDLGLHAGARRQRGARIAGTVHGL